MSQLLKSLVDQKGSDLHISPDSPPRVRIDGKLLPLEVPNLTKEQTKLLCYSILTETQKKEFEETKELNLAFSMKSIGRFRANIYNQKNAVNGAFRLIASKILDLKDLDVPKQLKEICYFNKGLFLVCGQTGSGKSTTLAALINEINKNRHAHIITIEDPIEYIHKHGNSMVNQREIGEDTDNIRNALLSSLRQDPDVIMVGELRDTETIAKTITAAETGHLVFATLHSNSCIGAITRIIDAFPPHQQNQIRTQLSFSLIGILTQNLLPSKKGGRILVKELLLADVGIRAMIRENKIQTIYSAMQVGQEKTGMITQNQSLIELVKKRHISQKTALELAHEKNELERILEKMMLELYS